MGKQIGQSVNSATSPPLPRPDERESPADPIRARRVRSSRHSLATFEAAARFRFTRFYVASPIPLLAPVMTTPLSLIPGMRSDFYLLSTLKFPQRLPPTAPLGVSLKSRPIDCSFSLFIRRSSVRWELSRRQSTFQAYYNELCLALVTQ